MGRYVNFFGGSIIFGYVREIGKISQFSYKFNVNIFRYSVYNFKRIVF